VGGGVGFVAQCFSQSASDGYLPAPGPHITHCPLVLSSQCQSFEGLGVGGGVGFGVGGGVGLGVGFGVGLRVGGVGGGVGGVQCFSQSASDG
jgi:hypothetical protein